jgi:hypothetical protein
LENLVFKSQFAYWQPGDWFKYAYVDQSAIAGAPGVVQVPTAITAQGVPLINPNRAIDPIIGFQGSLLVEF